jgi:HK97 family phage portal protein
MSDAIDTAIAIEKAQTTLTPPGHNVRFALLGNAPTGDIVSYAKRQQYGMYYEMYRQHPIVRSIIDRKANYSIAGGYRFVAEDPKVQVSDDKIRKLKYFFRKSNAKQLLRNTYRDLDVYGESFWLIVRSMAATKTPLRAMRLNPRYMTAMIQDGVIVKWSYGPASPAGNAVEYDVNVVLHFKLDDPEDDTQGLSPLHSLQRTVATDVYAMEYNGTFFENSAQTGTIFIVKTSTGDEARRNREWLEANYVGAKNAHRPILLEGDVDVRRSISSSVEMQYMEGRRFNRQEICVVLEMDEARLGIFDQATGAAANTSVQAFHADVIYPRQQIIEDEINNKLILDIFGWNDVLFNHEDGDPRRKLDNADVMDKNLKSGRQSLNEQRSEMGLSPVDGGDIHFLLTPAGAIPYSMLADVAENQFNTGDVIDNTTGEPNQAPVVEPISGVGTTSTGVPNPPQALTNEEKRVLNG